MVSPIATCAGGVYPSTHWRRYWWFHPLLLALVVFILPPTGADTVLALELLALCGGGFLVVVVVVVVIDVCVCGGGGCGYGVAVVVKCTGVSQRKYMLARKKPRPLAKKGSLHCYTMAHEQSACTYCVVVVVVF